VLKDVVLIHELKCFILKKAIFSLPYNPEACLSRSVNIVTFIDLLEVTVPPSITTFAPEARSLATS
jgi:hypothetical protein